MRRVVLVPLSVYSTPFPGVVGVQSPGQPSKADLDKYDKINDEMMNLASSAGQLNVTGNGKGLAECFLAVY